MLKKLSIADFSDKLASKETVLGGGSASALTGLLASSLVKMAVNHTLDSSPSKECKELLTEKRNALDELSCRLTCLIDKDARVLKELISTDAMKENFQEEWSAWQNKIETALEAAAKVPLEIAQACLEVIKIGCDISLMIEDNLKSDLMTGIINGHAGATGALMSSVINLGYLKDEGLITGLKKEISALKTGADKMKKKAEKLNFKDYPFSLLS